MSPSASPRPSLARLATVTHLSDAGPASMEPVPVATVQGTLALDLRAYPPSPEPPELCLAPTDGSTTGTASGSVNGTTDGCADDRAVQAWSAKFAQAVLEVLGGDRPLSQLLRWTDIRVYQDLTRRVQILSRRAPATQRLRTIRPQVCSVRVFRPNLLAAEVSVHVRHGERSRALAARLELTGGRWQCTALQFG